MEQPIEYFIAQARRISETSPNTRIHGVLFNTAIGAVASGTVYGHKTVPDGHQIRTSQIVAAYSINGFRIIETKSGSTYCWPASARAEFPRPVGHPAGTSEQQRRSPASLPRSDFSTFGPEFFMTSRQTRNSRRLRSVL
ncbi:MAG: hypothetical protein HT580_08310 [Dechloromonas sp.]|nr:MAG: hypothetical protein HT580_08310 [Dechloromonas sp.]